MKKNKITLYRPVLWKRHIDPLINLFTPSNNDWEFNIESLDIQRTGLPNKKKGTNHDGTVYKSLREYSNEGNLPIILLPIPHCMYNLARNNLAIVGPATKTNSDIFIFRNEVLPPNRRYLGNKKKQWIEIGVIENEITTTNISRVIIQNWSPDPYLLSKFDFADFEKDDMYEKFINSLKYVLDYFIKHRIRHIAYHTEERIEKIKQQSIDVAIFTGKKDIKKAKRENLKPILDLNKVICNIFNIDSFPRTVFTVFKDELKQLEKKAILENFINAYNNYTNLNELTKRNLMLIGSLSERKYCDVIIRFTESLVKDGLWMNDLGDNEKKNKFLDCPPISQKDFIWSESIFKEIAEKMKKFIKSIDEIDIGTVFGLAISTKNEEIEKIKQNLTEIKIKINELISKNVDISFEQVKNIIDNVFKESGKRTAIKGILNNQL